MSSSIKHDRPMPAPLARRQADRLSAAARGLDHVAFDADGQPRTDETAREAYRLRGDIVKSARKLRQYAERAESESPYKPEGKASFFRDLAMREHETYARDRMAQFNALDREEFAVSTGTLGAIIPGQLPPYIAEAIAYGLRSGAPLAAAMETLPLQEQGLNVSWGTVTTSATVGVQSAENATIPDSPDEVVTLKQDPIKMLAASAEFSAQSYERSGGWYDRIIGYELGQALAAELEALIWNGSGASGQFTGLLNATGKSTEALAGQTLANHATAIAGQYNAIANNLGVLPDLIAFAPRRYAYLQSLTAALGLPIENILPASLRDGVVVSPAAPTNLGGTQDSIVILNKAAVPLVRASEPTLQLMKEGPSVGPASLTWRFELSAYVALGVSRRPEGLGVVTGGTAPSL